MSRSINTGEKVRKESEDASVESQGGHSGLLVELLGLNIFAEPFVNSNRIP